MSPGRRGRPADVLAKGGLLAAFLAASVVYGLTAGDPEARVWFVLAVWLAGGALLLLHRRHTFSLGFVLVVAVGLRLLVFPMLPALSDDAYRYVWDGMLQAEGVNPYRHTPASDALAAFHASPLYASLNSAGFYSVYPPVSQLIFRVGVLLGDSWQGAYYVIKGIFVVLELGGVWLLGRMVAARHLLLYAWHPLAVVEVAGQGHTEAALVGFLALAVWAFRRGWLRGAGAALAAAGWVKLFPFLLLPLLGWRQRWTWAIPAGVVTLLLFLPYAHLATLPHMLDSLGLYVRYFEFYAGPYYALKHAVLFLTGFEPSKQLGPAFGLLLLGSLYALIRVAHRAGWPLERGLLWGSGLVLAWATTVHPWYLLAPLLLVVFYPGAAMHWHVLAAGAAGTYLFYTHDLYWPFVWAGWGGFFAIAGWRHRDEGLQVVLRYRARRKAAPIVGVLPPHVRAGGGRVLDLGCGEGYVGAALAAETGADVVLADVLPMNRTRLPFVQVGERALPFEDDAFDAALVYFVLHHTADPEAVLRELLRVTRGPVIVVESVYERAWDHRLLRWLDVLANRLRSGGRMQAQEAHLAFRTADAWEATFERLGARARRVWRQGRWVHRQVGFVVERH